MLMSGEGCVLVGGVLASLAGLSAGAICLEVGKSKFMY